MDMTVPSICPACSALNRQRMVAEQSAQLHIDLGNQAVFFQDQPRANIGELAHAGNRQGLAFEIFHPAYLGTHHQ